MLYPLLFSINCIGFLSTSSSFSDPFSPSNRVGPNLSDSRRYLPLRSRRSLSPFSFSVQRKIVSTQVEYHFVCRQKSHKCVSLRGSSNVPSLPSFDFVFLRSPPSSSREFNEDHPLKKGLPLRLFKWVVKSFFLSFDPRTEWVFCGSV